MFTRLSFCRHYVIPECSSPRRNPDPVSNHPSPHPDLSHVPTPRNSHSSGGQRERGNPLPVSTPHVVLINKGNEETAPWGGRRGGRACMEVCRAWLVSPGQLCWSPLGLTACSHCAWRSQPGPCEAAGLLLSAVLFYWSGFGFGSDCTRMQGAGVASLPSAEVPPLGGSGGIDTLTLAWE